MVLKLFDAIIYQRVEGFLLFQQSLSSMFAVF